MPASRLLEAADFLLEHGGITYGFGGNRAGDFNVCRRCETCVEEKRPASKKRFQVCPMCRECALDCSHFVELVFDLAGLSMAYLPTAEMLRLSPAKLRQAFGLEVVPLRHDHLRAGDLLVYKGHVVILESPRDQGRGDIVHSTSGSVVKGAGQGIQRERLADIFHYRGPLRRVLRHVGVRPATAQGQGQTGPGSFPR